MALAGEAPPTDGKKRPANRRNGRSKKTVQGDLGEVTLSTPRDRNGTFEPLLIEKHQRRVPGFDEKILALYAKGMTTRDIQEIVQELYGVEVSATLVKFVHPWGFRLDTRSAALVAVTQGRCFLRQPGVDPVVLVAGDVALVPTTRRGHELASTPAGPPEVDASKRGQQTSHRA